MIASGVLKRRRDKLKRDIGQVMHRTGTRALTRRGDGHNVDDVLRGNIVLARNLGLSGAMQTALAPQVVPVLQRSGGADHPLRESASARRRRYPR